MLYHSSLVSGGAIKPLVTYIPRKINAYCYKSNSATMLWKSSLIVQILDFSTFIRHRRCKSGTLYTVTIVCVLEAVYHAMFLSYSITVMVKWINWSHIYLFMCAYQPQWVHDPVYLVKSAVGRYENFVDPGHNSVLASYPHPSSRSRHIKHSLWWEHARQILWKDVCNFGDTVNRLQKSVAACAHR